MFQPVEDKYIYTHMHVSQIICKLHALTLHIWLVIDIYKDLLAYIPLHIGLRRKIRIAGCALPYLKYGIGYWGD